MLRLDRFLRSLISLFVMVVSRLQFHILVGASSDGKSNVTLIRRVRFAESDTWYGFPAEAHPCSAHPDLIKVPIIKSAISSLKSRGSYRNVNVTLSSDVYSQYVDDDDNFVFGDCVLGELDVSPARSSSDSSPSASDSVVACLERLSAPKEDSLKEILRHILLEKFLPKNRNVESWCDRFEKELDRFKLSGRRQVEVLKSCLDPSLNNWFIVTQENLPTDAEWLLWRQELIANFGDCSFRPLCSAIGFKYIGGSLVDYAINKEKLLIESNRGYSRSVMLDLIVYGLPSHIIKSLNKNNITNMQLLKDKLKKYEGDDKFNSNKIKSSVRSSSPNSFRRFDNKNNVNNNVNAGKKNFSKVKECSFCAKKGNPGRLHPESNCWFKERQETPQKSVNNLELASSSSEDELPKN